MAVPLLDLKRQYEYLKPEMDKAVLNVLENCRFVLGPEVTEMEEKVAEISGVDYGIGVNSGTDALLVALRAVGVKPGDEVITTDFSFFASAGSVSRVGAKPVFIDIEPDSYNIDVSKIEEAINEKTKVIMPVHLYGQMADMDSICALAQKYNLKVVEDAAQSIGATYKGKPAGSFGNISCYSFYPSKNLGAGGDGGMIVCKTEEDYKACRSLRAHGENPKYYHQTIGYNSRLDTMQAAMLLVKLPYLKEWSKKRQAHAKIYDDAFANIDDLVTPAVKDYSTFHIYNQYTIASSKRDKIIEALQKNSIGHCIYYPVPFHAQQCFADLNCDPNDFPVSSKASKEVVSIPIYPEMTADEQSQVIEAIIKACQ